MERMALHLKLAKIERNCSLMRRDRSLTHRYRSSYRLNPSLI